MFGDMGVITDGAFETAEHLSNDYQKYNLSLVLLIGDLSYGEGHGYLWEQWMNLISSTIATKVAFMVSIGNHEYDHMLPSATGTGYDISGAKGNGFHPIWGNFGDDSNGECGVPTAKRFYGPKSTFSETNNINTNNINTNRYNIKQMKTIKTMRTGENDENVNVTSNGVFWYSFNYESMHVIMLSSEHSYYHNSSYETPAFSFVKNDLMRVNRTLTPWLVVGIHRPLYTSQDEIYDIEIGMHLLNELEDIMYEYQVDVVFAGHLHSYQRTCALYQWKCVGRNIDSKNGITYITVGTGGHRLSYEDFTVADWSEYFQNQYWGYSRIHVNRTHFLFEYILDINASVVDYVVLQQQ